MLVAPQSIEASLIARRLQRWGGQTCMVSDVEVAQALLPERSWHAVLIDHAIGAADIETLGEAARSHATQRIVMFTPATRQELQPSVAPPPSPAIWSSRCAQPRSRPASPRRRKIAAPDLAGEAAIELPTRSRRRRRRAGARACRSWSPKTTRSTRC